MDIDILKPPMSSDEIASKRVANAQREQQLKKRFQWIKYIVYTVTLLFLVWRVSHVPIISDGSIDPVFLMVALFFAGSLLSNWPLLVIVALLVLAPASIAEDSIGTAEGFSVIIIAVSIIISAIAVIISYVVFVSETTNDCEIQMQELLDLEYSEFPDQCIAFDEWREQDDEFKTYSNAIALMERKPIVAEYKAAKEWIKNQKERQESNEKILKAQQACHRMSEQV